ncbi:MAG: ATP-binding protein [Chthoniobacterales bacterium]
MLQLEQLVTSGHCARPTGQLWYGPEGTRKTGSAVSPKTLFLDLERGSDQYDCDRIHIETYRDLIQSLDLIVREKSRHEIIVVDPIEIAEKLLIGETCRQVKIDGLQGLPHGAAWQYLRENFDTQLMARFSEIRRTGRHMVVIGHTQVRTVTLPGLAEPFDRYEPRIDKRNADTLVEWADHVVFFDWDIRTAKNREGIVRALSSNEPIVRVVHGPGWTAKNRCGLVEPLKPNFDALAPLFGTLTTLDRPEATPAAPGAIPATAPQPDSRTKQAPPSPDEAITDPFLSDQESRTIEALLSDLPQERLLAFLRERGLIKTDEDYHMLGPHYKRRILADPEGFKEAVGA